MVAESQNGDMDRMLPRTYPQFLISSSEAPPPKVQSLHEQPRHKSLLRKTPTPEHQELGIQRRLVKPAEIKQGRKEDEIWAKRALHTWWALS